MVTSAVLGAAAGTGLALVVAMTIVVYRYYAVRRRGKDWSRLERFGDTSLLGGDWSGFRKSKPHQPIYTVTQKVSTSFIHSVTAWLLCKERYAEVRLSDYV
jgi:hypothetical protein